MVNVDGVNINATHYAAMDKSKAVADMTFVGTGDDEGVKGLAAAHGKDAAWAGKAFEAAVKAVNDDKIAEEKRLAKLNKAATVADVKPAK